MAENKMKQVAELLGVEMYKPFNIKVDRYNPFIFNNDGLFDCENCSRAELLISLLNGTYEIEKPILTQKEKTYLEGVLRPFKDKVNFIEKQNNNIGYYIVIDLEEDTFYLPYFEKDTMYKGMELKKEYTLQELGLFENEKRCER